MRIENTPQRAIWHCQAWFPSFSYNILITYPWDRQASEQQFNSVAQNKYCQ